MTVLLQVSDPHFGTEVPEVVRALRRLASEEQPGVLVLSGDITQRARSKQFAAVRRFVDALAIEHVLAVPGNHDIPLFNLPARLFRPYGNYLACFGAPLEPELDLEDLLVVCVKTTRRWRHKNGELSGAQIERVTRRLRAAHVRQLRIVVTHQPVFVVTKKDLRNRVRGAERAVPAWAEAGADIVLGGHIHLPYHSQLVPGPRAMWAVQAGTAVSWRVRGNIPNSVNLIRHEARTAPLTAWLERWDFDAESGRFACVDRLEMGLDRSTRRSREASSPPSASNPSNSRAT